MLDDLLVLDLSRVLAGPYCTQLLADLGARVIKVEAPRGDDTRSWGPPFVGGESAYFLSVNRGKESLAVDLKDPRGRALVGRLARRADVLVENFKVGDLARYGLDYPTLAADRPGLVYASITGFGQSGPRAGDPGYDAALQALTGVMAMTGEPDGAPVKLGVAWIDVLAGVHAATAVLAALIARGRHGRGAHLDLALFDVALASLVNQAQSTLLTGRAPRRLGSAHPNIVPYQAFQAADGALVVAVGNDAQFVRLCGALGLETMARDPRFLTNAGRVEHRDALLPRLAARLRSAPRDRWLALLRDAGVPATPVAELTEALADAQTAARRMVVRGAHPAAGNLPMMASALWHVRGPDGAEVSLAPPDGEAAVPPRLGADSARVLQRELGLTAGEVAALRADGVVVTADDAGGAP